MGIGEGNENTFFKWLLKRAYIYIYIYISKRRVITPCKKNGSVCVWGGGGGGIGGEGERREGKWQISIPESGRGWKEGVGGGGFVLFPGTKARTFVVQAYMLRTVQFGTHQHLKDGISVGWLQFSEI